MKIDEKHSAIMMERIFDCQDEYELIELVSGRDKRRIPIHRVILMAASEYFADLFLTNDSSEKPKEIYIDSSGGMIETVVNFCYSGHIDLIEQNVESCVKIATDCEIDLLLNECNDYYAAKLSTENVVDILLFAAKHNFDNLQQRALEILCFNFEQVSATHILQLNPGMMSHLLANADEAVSSDLLAERLLSWFQLNEAERGEDMPKLLRLIRIEKMTAEFLCDTIEPLFKQFKCTELLYDEFRRRVMNPKPSSGCLSIKDNEATTSDKIEVFLVRSENQNQELTVARYDASLNKFIRHFTVSMIYSQLDHTSYILYGNKLIATGSEDSNIAYDMKNGKVERLLPMNKNRYNHASILMEKSLYVIGGHDGYDFVSSCERYDMEKGTWQTINSLNRSRSHATAAILNGLIYVLGGNGWSQTPGFWGLSTLVESYDPKSDQWTERMAIDIGTCLNPTSLLTFNGMLYAFVDRLGAREYDPVKNIWTKIKNDYKFRSVLSANGSIIAVTENEQFGQVTINKREINFTERTKVANSHVGLLSLQQCRFIE